MINYSIVMRSVNANLLAINQAKKEGKEPQKEERSLPSTSPPMAACTED